MNLSSGNERGMSSRNIHTILYSIILGELSVTSHKENLKVEK